LIGVLILLVIAIWIYASIPKTDSFFVRDAQFFRVDFSDYLPEQEAWKRETPLPKPAYHVQNHWVSSGHGIIFGWRYYSNGSLMVIDDELYRKITIWVPELPTKEISFGDKTKAIGYYSHGSSAWPRAGCRGEIASGTLQVIGQSESKVRLKIVGVADCLNPAKKSLKKLIWTKPFRSRGLSFPKLRLG